MPVSELSPRERVKLALQHQEPDRVPVDFLATPEVWSKLEQHLTPDPNTVGTSAYFDPAWEAILRIRPVNCNSARKTDCTAGGRKDEKGVALSIGSETR